MWSRNDDVCSSNVRYLQFVTLNVLFFSFSVAAPYCEDLKSLDSSASGNPGKEGFSIFRDCHIFTVAIVKEFADSG